MIELKALTPLERKVLSRAVNRFFVMAYLTVLTQPWGCWWELVIRKA